MKPMDARRRPRRLPARLLALVSCTLAACGPGGTPLPPARAGRATGPLGVLASNPRYFTDDSGRAIYLTGSHNWLNFQDTTATGADTAPPFDYHAYLGFLVRHNHNFFRLWRFESGEWMAGFERDVRIAPMPYLRTGPGMALDGRPRYDLSRFNPAYFERMRARVREAAEHGIYVSVMLFNGWSIETKDHPGGDPWRGHPFNAANNINGVDGDPDHHGNGREVQTLQLPAITALQEAYVRRVVDAVDDLDNVLYEISNESRPESWPWQYHMIAYVKQYEATKPKQHPVGMTVGYPDDDNAALWASPADWISPNDTGGYLTDPPPGDGRKVVLTDTDHLCGICVRAGWVWKSFLRGLNPILMDPYDRRDLPQYYHPGDPAFERARRDMGYALTYANRIPLATMTPAGGLATSGYCLAHASAQDPAYLVYLPRGGRVTVDLSATPDPLRVEWFSPRYDRVLNAEAVPGGGKRSFSAPFRGDAVLYLH
jgi:hypothetical protein